MIQQKFSTNFFVCTIEQAVIIFIVLLIGIFFSGCDQADDPVILTPPDGMAAVNGIVNGDFEAGHTLEEGGWIWWSHEDLGSATYSSQARTGSRSVKIERKVDEPYSGYQDWTLTNSGRLDVTEGEVWTASVWVKYEDTDRIALDVLELGADGIPLIYHPPGGGGGTHEAYGTGGWTFLQATSIVPADCKQLEVRIKGVGITNAWVDDVRMTRGPAVRTTAPKPKFQGWAFDGERVRESLGRGMVAVPRQEGDMYIRWRLLEDDPDDVAFNIYRSSQGQKPLKLNDSPIRTTTDFIDQTANPAHENSYFVKAITEGREWEASQSYTVEAGTQPGVYKSLKLKTDSTTFRHVGIGDLNGDGRYDYVIKTPNSNIDPWYRGWRPSDTTYTLQAYLSDGTFLWEKDLGWSIEAGVWYSPFIVYDFNGDGRAEVAVKTAPDGSDYRDERSAEDNRYAAGRVRKGPEHLSIIDGMTGEEKARIDWPSRDGLGAYNYYSRNQMGVAYLDGKTPAILAARGTYGLMKLQAFQYHNGKLERIWDWESPDEPGGFYYGQGAHNLLTADLDGDGRDEIILGSAIIDDNGDGLWSTGMGHPDNVYLGNLDPTRPGLEVYFGLETDHKRYGMNMVDAKTGVMIWGLNEPTDHIHASGLVSNIDTSHVGMESYGGERHTNQRWLHTSRGVLLAREDEIPMQTLSLGAVYWDATTQREVIDGERIFRYPNNQTVFEGVEGRQTAWVDLFGDWREEIITSVPGELRIYLTPIPARDRRVTLMQDPLYRSSVVHMAMGYGDNPALTRYFIE